MVSTADSGGDDGAEGAHLTDEEASLVQGGAHSVFAGPAASAGFGGNVLGSGAAARGDEQMQSAAQVTDCDWTSQPPRTVNAEISIFGHTPFCLVEFLPIRFDVSRDRRTVGMQGGAPDHVLAVPSPTTAAQQEFQSAGHENSAPPPHAFPGVLLCHTWTRSGEWWLCPAIAHGADTERTNMLF